MSNLDVEFVRRQFPAFSDPETARWAHLENAGGSYVPRQVIDLLTRFFTSWKVQPYWDFGPSRAAGEAMDRAREVMAATFDAPTTEIHFGPSTSQNTYVLAHALRPMWDEGDEIVVTNQDHEANIGSWRRLADTGMVVREWQVDPGTGLLDIADLGALLSDRTRLVAVTHASNVAATMNPIRDIVDQAHSVGAIVVVDGVSYAPHARVDVQDLGCDVYLYSTYKTFGPHVGMMWTSSELLDRLTSQAHYFNEDQPTARLTPAGPDHAAIAACAGIVDYYDDVYRQHVGDPAAVEPVERVRGVFSLFGAHEQRLMVPLIEAVTGHDDLRLVGSPSTDHAVRAPTVAFHQPGRPSSEIYAALIDAGVACGHGNFYARRLVEALGLDPDDGVVRLSLVHYNTDDDIARAVEVIEAL